MLALTDSQRQRHCQGASRRDFLKIGALGLAGWTLPQLLATRARAAETGFPLKDRAVVLLFLQGGPSHIEMFDPKMSAPVEFRSVTGEIATAHPGITFGGTFPKLAALAKQFSLVRSFASGNNDHSYLGVMSAGNRFKAAHSALYSRTAGATHPQTGLPRNVVLLPESIQAGLKLKSNFETGVISTLTEPGELGASYGAFNPSGGGALQESMELRLPRERFTDRRALLTELDGFRRRVEQSGALAGADQFQRQAFDVIARGVAKAFDLRHEDPATLAKYDTTGLFKLDEVTRYLNMNRSSNLLGHQMLLARRLCETGCGFVTVSDCGWDMHADGNSMPGMEGMEYLGRQVDHAVAAFLTDVAERGLSDKILLVVTGEMGRTPRINNRGGRDHYGNLTPLLLAGGGLPMGQVIGQSDRTASRAVGEPYGPKHLWGTIFSQLFDLGQLRISNAVPAAMASYLSGLPTIGELTG